MLKTVFKFAINVITCIAFAISFNSCAQSQLVTGAQSKDTISVVKFGATGNDKTDDSKAFQQAIDFAAKAKQVLFVPKGKYYVKDVELRSNTYLAGESGSSIHKIFDGIYAIGCNFSYLKPQNDPAGKLNVKNITINNLHFAGTSEKDGFSEHKHLLNLNGVENVLVENSSFTAFNGDGIYIGSDVGTERHNKNVLIKNSKFDGVNKQNRNAISVIDGTGITITNNTFMNTTRANMPGAIDFEPDAFPFHVIKNIEVINNSFTNIGGGVGTIAVVVPLSQQQLHTPVQVIRIKGNVMNNVANGIAVFHRNKAEKRSQLHDITIAENSITQVAGYPLAIYGVGNVEVYENKFDGYKASIIIGLSEEGYQCYDISFKRNLVKGNNGDGVGVSLRMVDGFESEVNVFENIGMADGKYGIAIIGETKGKTSRIRLNGDKVKGNKTTAFTAINPGHITEKATNLLKTDGKENKLKSFFPFKNH